MPKKNQKVDSKKETPHYNKIMYNDGFANFLNNLGIGADNMLTASQYLFTDLTKNYVKLEAMYRTSWIVGAVVDTIADDMTRSGIKIVSEIDPEESKQIFNEIENKSVWKSINELIKWGRLYGGAAGYIDIAGQDPSTPLIIDRVGKGQFRGITVFDRWSITPSVLEAIPYGANAGEPLYYDLFYQYYNSDERLEIYRVHHSRMIRAEGNVLPMRQRINEEMWGQSVIERMLDRLLAYDSATMSTANLIDRANVRIVRVDQLREVLAAGGKSQSNLLNYYNFMKLLQSNSGMTLMDKNDEFEAISYNFSGLDTVLLSLSQQVAGATKIPLIKLFGQSPSGLNSNGDNEVRIYYDNILALQQSDLKPGLHKLLRIIYQSEFGKPAPEDFDYKFIPLWQTTQKEKAENSSLIASQVALMIERGIISYEVALKELKQSSEETGIFTNITDEDIEDARLLPPPQPEAATQPEEQPDQENEEIEQIAKV